MNRDNIIRMAREAGMIRTHYTGRWDAQQNELEQFAALVAAAERKACSKVCSVLTFAIATSAEGIAQSIAKEVLARETER